MAKKRKMPDMNLPVWFEGQNINEALFCEEFLQERRIIFANRAFFTPNGRVTDDIVLRGEVYEKLKSYTISSVPLDTWMRSCSGGKSGTCASSFSTSRMLVIFRGMLFTAQHFNSS